MAPSPVSSTFISTIVDAAVFVTPETGVCRQNFGSHAYKLLATILPVEAGSKQAVCKV